MITTSPDILCVTMSFISVCVNTSELNLHTAYATCYIIGTCHFEHVCAGVSALVSSD